MKTKLTALFLAAVLLPLSSLRAGVDIPVDELPAVVKRAIDERFPGARYFSAERDTDDGLVVYEVDIEHDGKKLEVEITSDGKIVEIDD